VIVAELAMEIFEKLLTKHPNHGNSLENPRIQPPNHEEATGNCVTKNIEGADEKFDQIAIDQLTCQSSASQK
jgi:hypothetical protein